MMIILWIDCYCSYEPLKIDSYLIPKIYIYNLITVFAIWYLNILRFFPFARDSTKPTMWYLITSLHPLLSFPSHPCGGWWKDILWTKTSWKTIVGVYPFVPWSVKVFPIQGFTHIICLIFGGYLSVCVPLFSMTPPPPPPMIIGRWTLYRYHEYLLIITYLQIKQTHFMWIKWHHHKKPHRQ